MQSGLSAIARNSLVLVAETSAVSPGIALCFFFSKSLWVPFAVASWSFFLLSPALEIQVPPLPIRTFFFPPWNLRFVDFSFPVEGARPEGPRNGSETHVNQDAIANNGGVCFGNVQNPRSSPRTPGQGRVFRSRHQIMPTQSKPKTPSMVLLRPAISSGSRNHNTKGIPRFLGVHPVPAAAGR